MSQVYDNWSIGGVLCCNSLAIRSSRIDFNQRLFREQVSYRKNSLRVDQSMNYLGTVLKIPCPLIYSTFVDFKKAFDSLNQDNVSKRASA
jgi:hypothetical protein